MAEAHDRQNSGPDLWAIGAGWIALVVGVITVNRWAWQQNIGDVWVIRGLIVTFAMALTWLFGYWSQILDGGKEWVRRGGLNSALVTLSVILVAVGINYIFHRYHWQKDLTKGQRFTLADRSIQIVRGLKRPLHATAFFLGTGGNRQQAENLLRQYGDASNNFKYRLVDPLWNPNEARDKGLETTEGVIFEYGGKKQQVATVSEKDWTTALLKLTRDKSPKVYFLQGHGEMSYEGGMGGTADPRSLSAAAEMLTNAQWKLEKLYLAGPDAKNPEPSDAGVIIIADPKKNLTPEEEKRLNDYLGKGGRILALVGPGDPDLAAVTKPYGIDVGNDYVYGLLQGGLILIEQPEQHAITRQLARLLLLDARTVTPAAKPPTGMTVESLLKSSARSISSPKRLTTLSPGQPGTKNGPFTLAAVATKPGGAGGPESRMVVVGSSTSFSDAVLRTPGGSQFYNGDFFSNAVNWLGDQTELVSIEAKNTAPESLPVTAQEFWLISLIFFVEFPLLAVALGIYVYLKRR